MIPQTFAVTGRQRPDRSFNFSAGAYRMLKLDRLGRMVK